MKVRLLTLLTLVLCCFVVLSACGPQPPTIPTIVFDIKNYLGSGNNPTPNACALTAITRILAPGTLKVGSTANIAAAVEGSTAGCQFSWPPPGPNCTVGNSTGPTNILTGVAKGTCSVSVISGQFSAQADVEVNP